MRVLLVMLAAVLVACNGAGPRAPTGPAPAWSEVVPAYNGRAEAMKRFWSRATVRFTAKDAEGKRRTEQGDGYVQVIQPAHVSLSVGSYLDRMYFYLGCNAERYWWIDSMKDDAHVALVGSIPLANRERSAELGVPVHPLDLLELLAITPLPEEGADPVWSGDGASIMLQAPARWGTRRVFLDRLTRDPVRVELLDDAGRLVASADHRLHIPVRIEGAGVYPSIGGRITIALPTLEAEVIIDLKDPESSTARPKARAFDLDALLRATRTTDVRSLD